MRLLFIASRVPHPHRRGDTLRAYYLLRQLRRNHQITLIAPCNTESAADADKMRDLCDQLVLVPTRAIDGIANVLRGEVGSLPLQVLYFCPACFIERVKEVVQRERFDLAHIQLARMGPVLDVLGHLPSVIDFVDCLSLNMSRRAEHERWPKKLLFEMEDERMASYEQSLIKRTRLQTVSSPVDKQALGDHPSIHVVPNGVTIEDYGFRASRRANQDIIFSGNMNYFPNVDAAGFFVREIFPLVCEQFPRARFLITGAHPTRRVFELGKISGVSVTGTVPDLRSHIQNAALAVSPTRTGSGMQFKVLEAMALGTPVVATPKALGGAKFEHEKHLLVAETPADFARQVIRLLQDEKLQDHLAGNARELVETKFTWSESVRGLEMVYERAITL